VCSRAHSRDAGAALRASRLELAGISCTSLLRTHLCRRATGAQVRDSHRLPLEAEDLQCHIHNSAGCKTDDASSPFAWKADWRRPQADERPGDQARHTVPCWTSHARLAAAARCRRRMRRGSGLCIWAATAPDRSAFRARSAVFSDFSRASAGCRPTRSRRWACAYRSMARTVADAALMMNVLSAFDHRDSYALPPKTGIPRRPRRRVRGWRVAVQSTLGYARVDPRDCRGSGRSGTAIRDAWRYRRRDRRDFSFSAQAIFTLWAAVQPYSSARILPTARAGQPGAASPPTAAKASRSARSITSARPRPHRARPTDGGIPSEIRICWLTPTMPIPALPVGQDLNDSATERHWIDLVAVQLSLQYDPPSRRRASPAA